MMRTLGGGKCNPKRLAKTVIAPGNTEVIDSIPTSAVNSAEYLMTYEDNVSGAVKTAKIVASFDETRSMESCFALVGKSPVENTTGAVSAQIFNLSVTNTGLNPISVCGTRTI